MEGSNEWKRHTSPVLGDGAEVTTGEGAAVGSLEPARRPAVARRFRSYEEASVRLHRENCTDLLTVLCGCGGSGSGSGLGSGGGGGPSISIISGSFSGGVGAGTGVADGRVALRVRDFFVPSVPAVLRDGSLGCVEGMTGGRDGARDDARVEPNREYQSTAARREESYSRRRAGSGSTSASGSAGWVAAGAPAQQSM